MLEWYANNTKITLKLKNGL